MFVPSRTVVIHLTRLLSWLLWFLFGASLLLVFGEALFEHMQRAADPAALNDDARQQIAPLLRYENAALFGDDGKLVASLDTKSRVTRAVFSAEEFL